MSDIRPLIGGNWKSFNDKNKVTTLVNDLKSLSFPDKNSLDVVIAPTFLYLDSVNHAIGDKFIVSAQNCAAYDDGAYTGEISAKGLASAGITYTIIGHSERRTIFGENDDIQVIKATKALESGLNIIYCIGETLQQRKDNETLKICRSQLDYITPLLQKYDSQRFVIAYEPVWAIGTGLVPTIEQIAEVHNDIRIWLSQHTPNNTGKNIRILYGGSVKSSNASDMAKIPHVNGFLVGGASLQAKEFLAISQAIATPKL